MKILLSALTLAFCLLSIKGNSQNIVTAGPLVGYRGDTLRMTIELSGGANNPAFKIARGALYFWSWQAILKTEKTWDVIFIVPENFPEDTSYVISLLGGGTYSKSITITSRTFPEKIKFEGANHLNFNIGDYSVEGIRGMVKDSQGNLYCAGSFYSKYRVSGKTFKPLGIRDGFVAKYNSSGQLLWFKQLGGKNDQTALSNPTYDHISGIKIYNDTSLYISGYVVSDTTLKYDGQPLGVVSRNEGSMDGILLKLDTAGNYRFHAFQGSLRHDQSSALDIDQQGNCYISGFILGDKPYLWGFPADTCYTYVYSADRNDSVTFKTWSNTEYGFYISKYSADGQLIWAKMEDTRSGFCKDIRILSDNSIAVFGTANSVFSYDGVQIDSTTNGFSEQFLLRINSGDGSKIWAKGFGYSGKSGAFHTDADDNLYVSAFRNTSEHSYLRKYNKDGNFIWIKEITNMSFHGGNIVSTGDAQGNSYIGYSVSWPSPNDSWAVMLKKFDTNGNIQGWTGTTPYESKAQNLPSAIFMNPDGRVLLAGTFGARQNFDGTILTAEESTNAFLSYASFSATTGIADFEPLGAVNPLFPNPAGPNKSLYWNSPENGLAEITVLTSTGKRIYQDNVNLSIGNSLIYNTPESIESGVYFIQITLNNRTFSQRFLVQ